MALEKSGHHNPDDQDSSEFAGHHTLGPLRGQAADGAHAHTGSDNSVPLLFGVTLTGAKAGNTALASVIAALVVLGATDATT